jgi:Flp pilus assembly protein protease CpaA
MYDIFKIISLLGISIGSITDLKTLEVPDWLNYSLIALGIGGNLLFSIYYWDHTFILRSVLGFILAIIIGVLMFYTGQWGGGDSKMIFGLGALLGINYPFRFDFFIIFLINVLFFGAFYGLFWIIYLSIKNFSKVTKYFVKEFKKKKNTRIRRISGFIIFLVLILIFFTPLDSFSKISFSILLMVMYIMNYLYVFVRTIEKVAMIKNIDPEKLTEGDWIVDDIIVDNKRIVGPKDLGIEKSQIKELLKLKKEGKIDKVKVKYGIPFVPSFLLAFIYTLLYEKLILFALL